MGRGWDEGYEEGVIIPRAEITGPPLLEAEKRGPLSATLILREPLSLALLIGHIGMLIRFQSKDQIYRLYCPGRWRVLGMGWRFRCHWLAINESSPKSGSLIHLVLPVSSPAPGAVLMEVLKGILALHPPKSCNVPISEILKKPGSSGASPKSLARRVPQCSAGLHLIQPFAACKQPRVSQELTDATREKFKLYKWCTVKNNPRSRSAFPAQRRSLLLVSS